MPFRRVLQPFRRVRLALRTRKILTACFTDFFTDFEKKPTVLQSSLHMTEQFKLVTNAQESKIFESNARAIKIKCSNNFPWRYGVKITNISLE